MGITVPTGVASISAPPVRKITPSVSSNQNVSVCELVLNSNVNRLLI